MPWKCSACDFTNNASKDQACSVCGAAPRKRRPDPQGRDTEGDSGYDPTTRNSQSSPSAGMPTPGSSQRRRRSTRTPTEGMVTPLQRAFQKSVDRREAPATSTEITKKEGAVALPAPSCFMFQTAGGRSIKVSDESIQKSHARLWEQQQQEEEEEALVKTPLRRAIHDGSADSPSARRKRTESVLGATSMEIKKNEGEVALPGPAPSSFMFQTAGGRSIKVSDESVQRSRARLWEQQQEEEAPALTSGSGEGFSFTTAMGRSLLQTPEQKTKTATPAFVSPVLLALSKTPPTTTRRTFKPPMVLTQPRMTYKTASVLPHTPTPPPPSCEPFTYDRVLQHFRHGQGPWESLLSAGAARGHVSMEWVDNHTRWICWAYPPDRYPDAEDLLRSLCERYDTEYLQGYRSTLRLIAETDVVPSRLMVLALVGGANRKWEEEGRFEVTDGWYSARLVVDKPLLERLKALSPGVKIALWGAATETSDPVDPLEGTLTLKCCYNCVMPALPTSPLGLVVPCSHIPERRLSDTHPDGGRVSALRVVVLLVYPVFYFHRTTKRVTNYYDPEEDATEDPREVSRVRCYLVRDDLDDHAVLSLYSVDEDDFKEGNTLRVFGAMAMSVSNGYGGAQGGREGLRYARCSSLRCYGGKARVMAIKQSAPKGEAPLFRPLLESETSSRVEVDFEGFHYVRSDIDLRGISYIHFSRCVHEGEGGLLEVGVELQWKNTPTRGFKFPRLSPGGLYRIRNVRYGARHRREGSGGESMVLHSVFATELTEVQKMNILQ